MTNAEPARGTAEGPGEGRAARTKAGYRPGCGLCGRDHMDRTAALGQPGGKKGKLEGAPARAGRRAVGFGSVTGRKGRGESLGEGERSEPWS